jgi:small subunit ribosomal protein S2
MPRKKESEAEEKIEEKIIEDIEKGGVPEKIAEKEEKIEEEVEKDLEKRAGKEVNEFLEDAGLQGSEYSKKANSEQVQASSLKQRAEAESTISEKELQEAKNKVLSSSAEDIVRKKKEVLEKAKKLAEKISTGAITTEELKEKVKIKKRTDMLVPLEDYVKTGIYLGTRVVTPMMKPFVYRRRADGLAIFNTDIIDEKLKEGVEYLSKFAPEEVVLVCKRQAGWKTAEMFSKLTGIRTFTKKYPAGILTNIVLHDFFENELTIITDSWLDKNALHDTLNVKKKVLMICDTNNFSQGADKTIIGNNKSSKSLGLIFYLLARGYCKARGIEISDKMPDLDWWTTEEEPQVEIEKKTRMISPRYGV